MIIPDINLLVFAHNESDVNHAAALEWWRYLLSESQTIGLPWLVIVGFIRLTTKRAVLTEPLLPSESIGLVSSWFDYPHVEIVEPGVQHLVYLSNLLQAAGRAGDLVPDAHIAAIALEHDAEVHTHDRDFARFAGLRWRNPLTSAL